MKDEANILSVSSLEKILRKSFFCRLSSSEPIFKNLRFKLNFRKDTNSPCWFLCSLTWRILSAAGVTGPLAASATILACIRRALSFRITCTSSTVFRINCTSSTVFLINLTSTTIFRINCTSSTVFLINCTCSNVFRNPTQSVLCKVSFHLQKFKTKGKRPQSFHQYCGSRFFEYP